MPRPKLLDLFCGPGGSATGYDRAGFDVYGVDHIEQMNYPFSMWILDAMDVLKGNTHIDVQRYAAIHASPPCQAWSRATNITGTQDNHPQLIEEVRELLIATGKPWVIENVTEAPMQGVTLCGSQFGLRIQRHRRFETSWPAYTAPGGCNHSDIIVFDHKDERAYADAMECTWMSGKTARDAIPPAYTEFIGKQLMDEIEYGTLGT